MSAGPTPKGQPRITHDAPAGTSTDDSNRSAGCSCCGSALWVRFSRAERRRYKAEWGLVHDDGCPFSRTVTPHSAHGAKPRALNLGLGKP